MILNADSVLGELVFGEVLTPKDSREEAIDLFVERAKSILKERKSKKVI